MKFNELYSELRKKLQYSQDKINIETIPEDEMKLLVKLCDENQKVSLYKVNE